MLHGQWNSLRSFQNKAISAGESIWQIPERNHAWEVKRSDRGHNAYWLPNHALVNAMRDVFQIVALHEHGNAASYFHIFDGTPQFSLGFGQGLSIFFDQRPGNVVDVVFQ